MPQYMIQVWFDHDMHSTNVWIPFEFDGTKHEAVIHFADHLEAGKKAFQEYQNYSNSLLKALQEKEIDAEEWLELTRFESNEFQKVCLLGELTISDIVMSSWDESLADWDIYTIDEMIDLLKSERKYYGEA